MIRLSVTMLHTVLGVMSTTGAAWLTLQGAANRRWELGFYGVPTEPTEALLLAGLFSMSFGVLQAVSAWGWAVGARGAGGTLLVVCGVVTLASPPALGALVVLSAVIVALDLLVADAAAQREGGDAP